MPLHIYGGLRWCMGRENFVGPEVLSLWIIPCPFFGRASKNSLWSWRRGPAA